MILKKFIKNIKIPRTMSKFISFSSSLQNITSDIIIHFSSIKHSSYFFYITMLGESDIFGNTNTWSIAYIFTFSLLESTNSDKIN